MNINQNSWHYQWYRWTYRAFRQGRNPPNQTNLCQYCQRIFWTTLGFLPYLLFWLVWGIFYYAILTPFAFCFGLKPRWLLSDKMRYSDGIFDTYRGLWGWIYPWNLATLATVGYFYWCGWTQWLKSMAIGHVVIAMLVVGVLVMDWISHDRAGTGQLIRAWISSRKNRFCPTINFTNQPTSFNSDEQ